MPATRSPRPEGGSLAELTPKALRDWLAQRRQPGFRAGQILAWIYRRGAADFAAMTDLPIELRADLERTFAFPRLVPSRVSHSADGTRKLLFELGGNDAIESVLIPDAPRLTLCISSQAGCAMDCGFCATARLGLSRNLSPVEIAGQVVAAQAELAAGERITNLVFMGMGEPLHNYDNVVAAIEIISADWGIGLSSRRITVSTVGLVPRMKRLVENTDVMLAVSLTATTDELRDRLMPVNQRYPLAELMAMCRELPVPERRRITFEYVMLDGVNDSPDDARRLISLLRGIRAKVNLIPFNPFPGSAFRPSRDDVIERFRLHLLSAHLNVTVRRSRGRDIQAACGQLALSNREANATPTADLAAAASVL